MKDRSCKAVLKVVLVVINLVFFTIQFSNKFYAACASVPVRQSMDSSPRKATVLAGHTLMHGSADRKLLSLDKRYDSKHIFALLALFQDIVPPPGSNIDRLSAYQELLFIPPVLIPSQRGPPFV
jgi:hypothetical protein